MVLTISFGLRCAPASVQPALRASEMGLADQRPFATSNEYIRKPRMRVRRSSQNGVTAPATTNVETITNMDRVASEPAMAIRWQRIEAAVDEIDIAEKSQD